MNHSRIALRVCQWKRAVVTIILALWSPLLLKAQTCELYPIALSAQSLSNAVPGTVLTNLSNGTRPGNFGWLSWDGNLSDSAFLTSITPPGDSSSYVNPNNPNDDQLVVGDWVSSRQSVSNNKKMRDALNNLESISITVPVWSQSSSTTFRVSAFAIVRLLNFQLSGQNQITVQFLGYANCGAANEPPVVSAGPNQTVLWPSNQVTLQGVATDDGLPNGTLTVSWSKASGPGSVTFGNPAGTNSTATFSAPGVYVLQLSASDGAASTTAEVTITLDQPPVVSAGPNQTILWPSNKVTLQGVATDDGLPNGTLTVAWRKTSGPGTVTFANPAGTNTAATFSAPGRYVLSLSTSDGFTSSSASTTITVDQAPVVSAGPNQTILWPSNQVTLRGVATDDGLPNGTLSVAWLKTSGPGTVTFANPAGTNTTATFSAPGVYVLTLSASDGFAGSSATTTITVDQPPVVSAGPNQTILWPSNQVTLRGVATDDGLPNGTLTVTWSKASGPGTVTFANPAATNTTATFSASGLYVLKLSASDGAASSSASTTIIVDQAPTVSAGSNQVVTFPHAASLHGRVTDDGLPNGTLSINWSQLSGPGTVTFANPNSARTSASFSTNGIYVLQLTASDGLASNSATVTIIANEVPVVFAGTNRIINWPGNEVSLAGSAKDDGFPYGTLTTTWTLVSGPGTVTFGNPAVTNTTATFSASGVYVLRLTASDGAVSRSSQVRITVNQPPVVSAGPDQTILWPSNQVTLNGVATDDGLPHGTLTTRWSLVSGPGTVRFGSRSATNTTATFSAPGVYILQLSASDGATTNTAQVTITLSQSQNRPVVSAGPNQTILWPGNQVTLKGVATDTGLTNGTLTVTWSESSGPGTVTFANPAATNTTATFSAPGLYVLSLSASNGSGSSSASTTITVDQAPAVTLPAQFVINWPSNQLTLNGTVSDDGLPVGAVLNQVWTQTNGSGSISFAPPAQTNVLTGTAITNAISTLATVSAPGLYHVQLTADDGIGSKAVVATVIVNQAPTVSAGSNQVVTYPQSALLNGTASDDGLSNATLSITWSQVSGPGTVTFGNPNSASTTASFSISGVYVLQLTASDGLASNSSTVTITANLAPVVSAGPNQLITWPSNQVSLNGSATDDGLPYGTLATTWTAVSGPGTVTFGNPAATNTTATFSAPGVYVLLLTATDGAASKTAEVTVILNQPPVVTAGPDETILWPSNQVALNGIATDDGLPNGTLTVTWTKFSGPGTVTFGNPSVTNTTATFGAPGVYVLQLSASDGAVSTTAQVTITLNQSQPPLVSAGPDQTILWPSNQVALNGVATDKGLPNGTLTVTWSKTSGPGTVTFANPAATNTTATFSAPGLYVLSLSASDGFTNGSASTTITVDQAPTVTLPPQFIINWPSNQLTVNGTVSDDGLPVGAVLNQVWSQTNGPATISFSPPVRTNVLTGTAIVTNAISTTATLGAPGLYNIQLTADDGIGTNASNATIIVNQAPTVNAGSNEVVTFPQAAMLNGTATDDGLPYGTLTVTWSQVSGPGAVTFANPNSATTTASFSTSGVYVLKLTAGDGAASSSDTVTIIANQAPVVSAGPNQLITWPGNQVSLAGSATDDGLPNGTLTTTWASVSGPGTVTFGNPAVTNTTATFSAPGVYVLQLTANDGAASTTAQVSITLNQPPVVTAGSDQTILWPSNQVALNGVATDDGLPTGTLTTTWTSVSGPGTVTFGNPAATNTTATFSAPGVYVLQLAASDGAASKTAEVTIILNQAPNVSAGPDQVILWPSNQVTLRGVATDDGLPSGTLTVTWSKASGPGTVTFGNPAGTNSTATFSASGVYVLQLTATDGAASKTAEVMITLNQAPVVSAGPAQTILWPSNQVTLRGVATDDGLPNGTLSVSWSETSGPGTVTFANPTGTNSTATFSAPGLYVLSLSASDGSASSSASTTITVDQAPIATLPTQFVINWPSNQLNLNGTVSDDGLPVGAVLNQVWTQTNGPGTISFAPPVQTNVLTGTAITNALSTIATVSAPGLYKIQLTADDGIGTNAATATVIVNQAPVVSAGSNQVVTFPQSALLNGTVTDDGLPIGQLTYSWIQVSGPGIATFANPSTNSTTVSFSAAGLYVLQLSANDSLATGSDQVTILANIAPVAQSQSVTVVEDSSTNVVLQANDADGDSLTYAIVTPPQNGTLSQVSPNQYVYTPSATYFGTDSFTFKVNDGYIDSTPATVSVNVLARNHPPTFTAGPNQTVLENAGPQTVVGWASNISPGPADESFQTVHFLVSSDNPGLFSAGPSIAGNGTLTYTPAINVSGVATVTVKAQDNGGTDNGGTDTSAAQTFTITIVSPPLLSVPGPQTVEDAAPLIFNTNRLISMSDAYAGQGAMQLSVSVSNGVVSFGSTNGLSWVSGSNGSSSAVVTGTLADLNASLSNLTYTSVLHFNGTDTVSLVINDLGNNPLGTPLTDANSVSISVDETNHPFVSAGPDRAFSDTNTITLNGVVVDDAVPANSLVANWSKVYGPGNVTFGNSNSPVTTATFSTNGIYVLQLSGSDVLGSSSDFVTVRANEVCTVEPPSGLVAWWPGNLTAQDQVTGAVGVATNVSFVTGMVGPAFSFNGSSSFIDAPVQSGYNVGPGGLTIEFWIKPNNLQVGSVLGWGNGVRVERFTTTSAGDSLRFYLTGTSAGQFLSSPALWVGTNWAWTHVAVSYDPTSGITALYINGVLTVTGNVGTNPLSTAGDFRLGQVPGSANFYAGLLDEVSLYSRPLNAEEIYNIFAAGSVGKCPRDGDAPPLVYAGPDLFVTGLPGVATLAGQVTDTNSLPVHIEWSVFSGPGTVAFANAASANTTATFSTNGVYVLELTADDGEAQTSDLVEVRVEALCTTPALAGLVAWWPANGTVTDVINGYNDAVLYNGTGYTNGEVAAALNFNGSDNYVWMPAHPNYNVGASANGFTVEFWMSENSFLNSGVLGWANGVRIERVYGGTALGDSLRFDVSGTNANQSVTAPRIWTSSTQFNQWYHLALTYDRTSGLARIYVNGILNATANVGTSVMSTAGDFYLAQVPGSPGDFSGKLDEVSLYSRPLNAQEVYSLFSSGSTGKCPNENNSPPVVSAGPDLFITGSPGVATLNGQATDDGLPPGSTLQTGWSVVSGPGSVAFANPSSPVTSAIFSTNGIYVLQLTANDGEYQVSDLVEVRVDSVCVAQDPTGLAAWWPANNNSTEVLSGQNAILVNGTGYTAGKVANAFQFDGALDYIVAPASSNYDVGTSASGFTVEFWIKAAFSSSARAVLSWNNSAGGGTNNGVSLSESGSGAVWTIVDTAGVAHLIDGASGVQNVFNGNWRHMALSYNRSTGVAEVYVDGLLQFAQNIGSIQPQTSYDFVLGQSLTVSQLFLGQLDEISLYRRPLTQQEILNIYQSGSIGKCPENNNQPPTVYAGPELFLASTNVAAQLNGVAFDDGLPAGSVLQSQWTMLDGPGLVTFANPNSPATIATFSTNGIYTLQLAANDGEQQSVSLVEVRVSTPCAVSDIPGLVAWWTANGNTVDKVTRVPASLINGATYAPGKVAGSFEVNGTNDYVFAAAQTNYDVGSSTNGFTLEFWEKAAFSSAQRGVMGWNSYTSGGNADGVTLLQSGGSSAVFNLIDSTGAGHQLSSAANAFNGNWRHLALTYDRVAGVAKVYLDGALVVNQSIGIFQPQTAMDLNFGRVPNISSSFIGQFDEVSLYSRPLAQTEIQSIVGAGAAGKCVTPSNMPPVLTAGPSQTISFPTNTATLNGVVADDGLPINSLSIAWTYVAGNGTVFFSSTNTPVTTVTFTNIGTFTFQLSASDGQYSTNATTTVTVLPGQ